MKTYSVKAGEIKREWHVIDAKGKILGKLATEVARLLMGKHKAIYSRHLDTGDYVVVINATRVKVSGNKPERVIEHAVKGMLPGNRLGDSMIKKLRVYTGDSHPHPVKAVDN